MSFNSVNLEGFNKINKTFKTDAGVTPEEKNPTEDFDSMADILETFTLEGNYKLLGLCIRFMFNLYPQDLFMFFDGFTTIEESMFAERGIDYSPIKDAYIRTRNLIKKDYLEFMYAYYPDSVRGMYDILKTYTKEQLAFVLNRNASMTSFLPDIGTKISGDYYDNIIVDDTTSAF